MATTPHRTQVPLDVEGPATHFAKRLAELARTRTSGRCAIAGCGQLAQFVSCTVLARLDHGAAGINWTAVCARHASLFAVATNTPRPGV